MDDLTPGPGPEPPPGPTLLQRLKSATAALHDRIERRTPLVRDDLTLGVYRRTLARLLRLYDPWEQAAARVLRPRLPSLLEGRLKAPLLRADLRRLGDDEPDLGGPPLPPLATVPQVLGSMYVLEGATLGGPYIARHLERVLGLSDGIGYSFFRPYGPEAGRMWQSFGRVLLAASSPGTDPIIVASALATFEAIDGWLCGGDA